MGLKGAILGDISGSQYEFSNMRPNNLDWKNVPLFTDNCKRTDDTILSIATKCAVLDAQQEDLDHSDYIDFQTWYHKMGNSYNRGYGAMFYNWLKSDNPQPYNSFGNGSAMRVSFIGEYYDNPKEIFKYAKMSAAVTHNHPEGEKGAIVTAACIAMAKRGDNKDKIFNYVNRFYGDETKYRYPITMQLKDMRKIYRWNATCQDSVPAAIRCVLEAESYEEFMRNVMSLPCDMDTLGAIGGAIAEELFGLSEFDSDKILKKYLEPNLYDLVLK